MIQKLFLSLRKILIFICFGFLAIISAIGIFIIMAIMAIISIIRGKDLNPKWRNMHEKNRWRQKVKKIKTVKGSHEFDKKN